MSGHLDEQKDFLGQTFCTLGEIIGSLGSRLDRMLSDNRRGLMDERHSSNSLGLGRDRTGKTKTTVEDSGISMREERRGEERRGEERRGEERRGRAQSTEHRNGHRAQKHIRKYTIYTAGPEVIMQL
ncbi:hypothetical protein D4764_04G0012620 [Takifugu flavidus]|uniref:Uncharacterized protein n=1 Tax=Takifugu flavidus TaxID=433684 RepID=A0A5C6N6B3_9TELE|nr:hypothetical protein D4764_04G0012620 [Takifugu flavidus]